MTFAARHFWRRRGASDEHTQTGSVRRAYLSRRLILPCLALLAWVGGDGCALRQFAVNQVSNAVSQSGTSYASDDDPDLIKAASPFSLKLMESLLSDNPRHRGLLLASASGFTEYAFAFVQEEADEAEEHDLAGAEALRARARRLYLRAQGYGLRGLDVAHPGFSGALRAHPKIAVQTATKKDVPLLYWTGCAWAAAIALSKDNPDMIAQIPAMEALMDRALQLDESFDHGAIHDFMITYEMSRHDTAGDPAVRARRHFERAMVLSGGNEAAPLVDMAEAVDVQKQDLKEFDSLLQQALAINPDAHPEMRLVNLIMQRRARWLLARRADLFLVTP